MPSLLSQLAKGERARLLEELNYLNLAEIRGFCSARGIPYRILAEHPSGKVMITKDTDRKPIVLARIRDYLATGKVGPPTCIPAKIVRDDPPPARPGPQDRLYYRWYAKEHIGVYRSLRELTAGRFRMAPSPRTRHGVLDARRGADARRFRAGVDRRQRQQGLATHRGIRLPYGSPAQAGGKRLEEPAHGQSEVGLQTLARIA